MCILSAILVNTHFLSFELIHLHFDFNIGYIFVDERLLPTKVEGLVMSWLFPLEKLFKKVLSHLQ